MRQRRTPRLPEVVIVAANPPCAFRTLAGTLHSRFRGVTTWRVFIDALSRYVLVEALDATDTLGTMRIATPTAAEIANAFLI